MLRLLITLLFAAPVLAELHTTRTGAKVLPLPKSDEAFNVIIYGDRTGGKPEGLKVLQQAVKDTNLLAPDMVMTVGDLINGYCQQEEWQREATEYSDIMHGLKMPWFPVAGNHDIYWRGPNKPPMEHEANFERHFGPLWYWFEHKRCGFLALYSDEGDVAKGAKDFTKPDQSRMSQTQLDWMAKSLEEMKKRGLKQVFVFLHHPKWIQRTYPATNWDAVHQRLKDSGIVRAVFAGHIHRLHYGGKRDGIEYFALAATGASMPGVFPGAGYIHHFNVLTVRPDKDYEVAVLPVGEVRDHRLYVPERQEDIDLARNITPEILSPPLTVGMEGQGGGVVEFTLKNPCKNPVELQLVPENEATEWFFAPGHIHCTIPAGEELRFMLTTIRTAPGFTGRLTMPSLKMNADYLEQATGLRITLPERSITLPAGLKQLPDGFFTDAANKALKLDGNAAYRVDMPANILSPDSPFTLEAWIRPAAVQSASYLAKTEQSDYALDLQNGVPGFHAHLGGTYSSAIAKDLTVAPEVWTHVAGVFDGQTMKLFVNGKLVASTPAKGPRKPNTLPLYVGADPDAKSQPGRFFKGQMDEVRISRSARYASDFTPATRHATGVDTVQLLHFDRELGGFMPSHTAGGRYAIPFGKTSLVDRSN